MGAFNCNICGAGFDCGDRECRCDDGTNTKPAASVGMNPTTLLAGAFIGILSKALSDEQFKEFVRKTRTDFRENICWSHNFCDANEVMLEAFKAVFDRDAEIWNEVDTDFINAAWTNAKRFIAGKE